ncbi:diaminopimelate epimerase [Salsuginibacillus kocurii]|uniref:diaminopimelate epimerase n=1 Tax=Salsuginibacillus kocurii TaxID=427078 RepID=UPI0003780BBA|nr:diaminopimelate epimerase [Salsuginibacillus kocurii]
MQFTKMHGLGNSYIYVDEWEVALQEDELAPLSIAVADSYTGIGSDGLILIGPSKDAAVRMRIFNNDGSEAKNCGNGLRCVAKYAYEKGYVAATSFYIETKGGNVEAHVNPSPDGYVHEVTINMGKPGLKRKDLPMGGGSPADLVIGEELEVENALYELTAVSMGNPHAIIFSKDVKKAPVETAGPIIEKDELFPEGVNVEFITVKSSTEIDFRVWERGSGITQACGTGACAAVVAAILNGESEKDQEVTVHLPGGDLYITWDSSSDTVWMKGAAETICTGEYVRNL